MDWENEVDRIFAKTLKNQLVAARKDWLERAVEQKSAHLTVGIAYSELLVYDRVDRLLLTASLNNYM